MATSDAPVRTRRMSRLERLPWRTIILTVLSVAIAAVVGVGAYRTISEGTYDAAAWQDFVVLGIAQGAIYALIALGYTLVYGVLRLINFAHSEVFMWGSFAAVWVLLALGAKGATGFGLVGFLVIGFLAAMAVSALRPGGPRRGQRHQPQAHPASSAQTVGCLLEPWSDQDFPASFDAAAYLLQPARPRMAPHASSRRDGCIEPQASQG